MAVGCAELEASPVPRSPPPDLIPGQGGGVARETGPRAVAGRSPVTRDTASTSPPRLPGLSPGPGRLLPPVKNPVVSAAPAAAWRRRVTSPHRSAAALPAAQAGDRPRWQRGPAEGWGAGWPHPEQACWGHFGLGGRVTNSTPSVAESELRQLRDCRCRRCLYSAAGDIGRRPLVTSGGGGGRGAGRAGGGQKVAIVPGGV